MTLQDQDKERLFLSTLISSVLFAVLFLTLNAIPWDSFEPFPETVPVVLIELEPVPEVTPLPPTPKEVPPSPFSPPLPEVSEARDLPAPVPLPPTPSEPVLPPQKTAPISPSQTQPSSPVRTPASPPPAPATPPSSVSPPAPSPFPLRQPLPEPVPRRIDPFTPTEGVDPRLSERQFLEAERSRLESWLKEYESTSTISAPDTSPTQPERQPVDPAVERIRQQLADINRRIQNLPSSPSTPSDARTDTTQATTPAGLQPILDREGLEIGRGNLRGRIPLFPLQIGRIYPEDFEGFPIQDLQLHAEFLIGESGLVEPGSLKISGDSRYTRIIAKVHTALERWRFDTRKGVITPASITFIIKVRGVSR